ncbi:MAG: flavodoxin family protein [Nitrospiraceae bacterium]|nr:flavodoxin family protein [Nitrospiraceae bacterium]
MKTAVFFGSPRRGGNTELLVNEALKGAQELGARVEFFNLNTMRIKGCQECGDCTETGVCAIRDDMQEIFSAIRECERFILASPVFFHNVSAQAKAMIDRCQAIWCEKYLRKKKIPEGPYGRRGLFIAVGGMKNEDGLKCASFTAKSFFRTISVPVHRDLGFMGVDAKGEILQRPGALRAAYEAGLELLKKED